MAPRYVKDDIPRWLRLLPDPAAARQLEEVVDACSPHDDLRRELDQYISRCLRTMNDPEVWRHAVALLVRLHRKGLERVLARFLHDKTKIADVIQEGTLKAMTNWDKFRDHEDQGSFSPWFHTIVRNARIDRFRKDGRVKDSLPADLADDDSDPALIVETADEIEHVRRRVRGLTSFEKRLLELRFVKGLTVQAILEAIPAREFPGRTRPSSVTLWRQFQRILAKLAGTNPTSDPEGGQP